MAVIWLATTNEGDAYGLYFKASVRELIINRFRGEMGGFSSG